jgi:hypothetical protein
MWARDLLVSGIGVWKRPTQNEMQQFPELRYGEKSVEQATLGLSSLRGKIQNAKMKRLLQSPDVREEDVGSATSVLGS